MRSCESCHSLEDTHDWLPYKTRHTDVLSCETCHIPNIYFSALEQVDWTAVTLDESPLVSYRGAESCSDIQLAGEDTSAGTLQLIANPGNPSAQATTLITGYQPILLPITQADGASKLAPFNLVTSWYWIYGEPAQPVPQAALQSAWLEDSAYVPEVLALFDANGDGFLANGELIIDQPEKEALIASRLAAQGLDNPRISAEIQPYSINHNVTHGEWAIQDCQTCHSEASRLAAPLQLAAYLPGDTLPEFVQDTKVIVNGEMQTQEDGSLVYYPDVAASDLYIFGNNRVAWVDLLGSLAFVGVLLGITVHGGMRFAASLRMPHGTPRTKKVYMYTVYERLWHWLQTITILLLLFTGLIIHRPDTFGIFNFRYVVQVHNILAVLLLINAGLSLFYHLASGEIKQYIPRIPGFFDQAIEQAVFYTRGIFQGQHHPFEKTPEKKLNPLQQITYFGILNVLLPLQIITGILMWGAQQFPEQINRLGGLPFLAPFHSLIAWLFAAFIVAHVYLTTTGPEPMAGIKAMMMGWDEVEIPYEVNEETEDDNNHRDQTQDA
jgi:thiosulfate reductase cytochrome b subunit